MSELGGFGIRKGGSGGGGTGLYVRLDGTTPLTNDWNAGSYTITSDSFVSTSDSTINSVNVGKGGGNISSNTSLGNNALISNTTGVNNTALGSTALQTNIIGNENTAIGSNSLLFNVADGNTAIGAYSQRTNSTGYYNTSVGRYTLRGNTTGQENTAIGYNALQANTIGADNVGLGISALNSNTTGSSNTALGSYTLPTNNGSNNVGIGMSSLYYNSSGSNNVGVGINSLINQTTASTNTAVGSYSLEHTIAGGNNVALGYGAGRHLADGSTANTAPTNSLFLGANTRSLGTTNDNQIVIGYLAIGNGSNTVTIGNSSITDTYLRGSLSINGAYTLPTTAPTSGQVLGYSSAGVSTWVTPTSASGIWGISNSSGVYTYYATLTLAVAGATSGQTIELFTDVVESTNTQVTLKDGVDINFNGHSYTLSASGTASCFYVNYAGRNRFYNGKINRTGGTISNSNSVCILVDAVASPAYAYLDFSGVEIYSSFGVGISGINNTIPYINGANIRTFSHGAYFNVGVIADNCTISTFGGGAGVYAGRITNSYVETSAGGSAIVFPYSGRASNCYAYAYGSGSGNAIYCQSGVVLTNCTAISTRNSAIYNFAATSYNCYAYSTAGAGFECGSNAGGGVYNSSAYSTAGSGTLYADTVSGCNVTSTSTYAVQGISGGVKTNVYNSSCFSSALTTCVNVNDFINNVVKCTWNNVGGSGVFCLANNTITNNTIIVTNASANALNASSAISLQYANNCFKGSTTPVNANITQLVTNTQDNQGNILL